MLAMASIGALLLHGVSRCKHTVRGTTESAPTHCLVFTLMAICCTKTQMCMFVTRDMRRERQPDAPCLLNCIWCLVFAVDMTELHLALQSWPPAVKKKKDVMHDKTMMLLRVSDKWVGGEGDEVRPPR